MIIYGTYRLINYILISVVLLLQITCNSENDMGNKEEKNIEHFMVDESAQGEKMIIYQVFTRLFGNKNSSNKTFGSVEENGVGKFNDFTDKALQEIRSMGFTHIWYTGVIEHAQMTDYSGFNIAKDNPEVVKGKAGSPYAIKDYFDVNPDLAEDVTNRMREFKELVKRTHRNNLKVIIDFVPNHVSREYNSDVNLADLKDLGDDDDPTAAFKPDNNFYYIPGKEFKVPEGYDPFGSGKSVNDQTQTYFESPAKATGNDVFVAEPSVYDWFETVKLNYGIDFQNSREKHFDPVPDTWKKMRTVLLYWAAKKIDGFRCDMAQMVPVEFWNWVIPQIKSQYPDLVFIAEIYDPSLYQIYIDQGKFDYLYDKVQLYDTLRHIIEGKGSVEHINTVVDDLKGLHAYMLRFLENHDEQRIASEYFAGDPFKAIPGMVISATLYSGPVMIYFGQEVGEPAAGMEGFSGEDGRTTIFDYWGVPEHQKWMNSGAFDGGALSKEQKELRNIYRELLNFCRNEEVIQKGNLLNLDALNRTNHPEYHDSIYSYIRYTDNEVCLVITNFSEEPVSGRIMITQEIQDKLGINLPVAVTDYFGDSRYNLNSDFLEYEISKFGYRILKLK